MANIGSCDLKITNGLVRIASIDGEGYQFIDDPQTAASALQRANAVDVLTFIQRLADRQPLYSYHIEWDNFAVLEISSFDDWWWSRIDKKVRNMVKKAEKSGVTVRELPFDDNLIHGIRNVYNEHPIRQGKRFWHYGKDFDSIRQMKSTFLDRSVFVGAFLEQELIGFIKLVMNEDKTQAGLMHIISMMSHRDKAPTNALIAEAVRVCAARRIPYLWYANFSYGRKEQDGLSEFKRHNGFEKILIPRYYVPVTRRGRIGLRLGLHHPLKNRVPDFLSSGFRMARNAYIQRAASRADTHA